MTKFASNLNPDKDPADGLFIVPKSRKKQAQFVNILKTVLPYIGSDEAKVILAEVMIALKVEGVIGQEMTPKTKKMVNVISESILAQPIKKKEALKFADRLLE